MKIAKSELSPKLLEELQALELLPDEGIDLSDVPEVSDWRAAVRGAFMPPLERREYDVRGLANWCLQRAQQVGKALSNLSLNKLVYFLVERALVEKRILLTSAKIEAWDHGPVFREIYHSLKNFGDKPIKAPLQSYCVANRGLVRAEQLLKGEDETFLTSVLNDYLEFSPSQLRQMSHIPGGAWDLVWHHKSRTNYGMEIPPALILSRAPTERASNERG
jgi:uncharacterized phage-associated protein